MIGGWPELMAQFGGAVAMACSLVWLLPFLRMETRVASFAFFGAHAYLSYYPYFPFPWYLPSTTLLAVFTLGSLLDQALQAAGRWQQAEPLDDRPRRLVAFVMVVAALLITGSGWMTWQTAREFRAQQRFIEDGTRRKVGEWLKANARPGDSVFLEPLGYIGFYSGLKTHDFPGMSSSEMVHARTQVGNDWSLLIQYLQPNWLVLRPHEATRIQRATPDLLTRYYLPAQEYSTVDEVVKLDVQGQLYLKHDAHFIIYRLQRPTLRKTAIAEISSQFDVSKMNLDGYAMNMVHAPGRFAVKVPVQAGSFEISYGYPPAAIAEAPRTDGAIFQIDWEAAGRIVSLLNVTLDPLNNPEHRKVQVFRGDLPVTTDPDARLIFRTLPGATTTKDWTCWTMPDFYKRR
jgi:hypothetical protein